MHEAFVQKQYCSVGRPLETPIGKCSSFYRVGDDQFLFRAGGRSLILTRAELLDLNPDRKVYLENISPTFKPIEARRGTAKKEVSEEDQKKFKAYLKQQEKMRQERQRERELARRLREEQERRLEIAQHQAYLARKAADKALQEERQAELEEIQNRNGKTPVIPEIPEKTEAEKQEIQNFLRLQSRERQAEVPFWLDPSKQWAD